MIDASSPVTQRPLPDPPRPYRFPPFQRGRLANGVQILVAQVRRTPLVTLRIVLDAGAARDPLEEAGLASLTAQAVAEGTVRLDGALLAREFERLGGTLSTHISWDSAGVQTTVLRERSAAAMALLAEVVREPAFPEREVLRLRDERLAELLELRTEPRGLADQRFAEFLYHVRSRYSLPQGGNEHTVQALSRAACARFHSQHYVPASTTLVAAGDIELGEVIDVAERHLGDWQGLPPQVAELVVEPARRERAVAVIDRPEAPQTEIRAGHIGLPRRHPDYFKVVVLNAILGGLFNSRLNLNLREEHGYTYGASSSFEWRRGAGPFTVSAAVATEVTLPAIGEILHELERIRSDPPEPHELTLATSFLQGVFPLRFETTEAIASALASLVIFGLPEDYYDRYRDLVGEVTAADVYEAARRHIRPDELQFVLVGDYDRIGSSLQDARLGSVVRFEAEQASLTLGSR